MILRLVMVFVFCGCLPIATAASPTTESPYPDSSSYPKYDDAAKELKASPAEEGSSAEALKASAALGHHKPHHHHRKHHPKGIQEVKDLPGGGVLAYNMSEGSGSAYMSTKMTSGDDEGAMTSNSPGKYSAAGAAMDSNGSDPAAAYTDVDGSGVAIQAGYDDAAALKTHHHGHGHHHAKLSAFAVKKHKHPGSEEELEGVKVSNFGGPRGHHHHKRPHSPIEGGDTDPKSVIPNHGLAEGWRHENANSYWIKELAKIATREINTALNFAYHMKLLKVFQARSKISNQNMYKMEMEIAPTNCRIEDSYTASDDRCQIQACSERQMCHIEIMLTDDKAGEQFIKDYGCYTVQPPYLC